MKSAPLKFLTLLILLLAAGAQAATPVITPLAAYAQSLHSPGRVATDAGGNCYATDPQAGRVVVYDAFGRVISTREGFARPLGIAVDSTGRIYVGEEATGSVSVFDAGWNLLYRLGAGAGEFRLPNYIAPDSGSGLVFVSDSFANQVRVYTNGGAFAFAFGALGTGGGQFDFPAGIHISSVGEVFVVDQKNNRVQVFDRGGVYLRLFKLAKSSFGTAGRSQGIAGDAAGHLLVAESFQSQVRAFDTNGVAVETNGVYGAAPGQFSLPTATAVDPFNRLIVASVNNGRLEVLGVDDYLHFSAQPALRTVAVGSTMEFSVAAGGPGPFTYQWRKDGAEIAGATNATLALFGISPGATGNYSVVVTGPTGSRTSPDAALTVLVPPTLLPPPASQIVAVGSNALLNVVATGDQLAYVWKHDGVILPAAMTSSLFLENVQPNDAGAYEVTIQNSVGSVTSEAARLTVIVPPSILVPPTSLNVAAGDTVTFSVNALGDALSYQWLFNGQPISGAVSSLLTLTNAQPADGGGYSVQIANLVGTVQSEDATLTVIPPPDAPMIDTVSVQPDGSLDISATAQAGYTFTICASSDLVDWVAVGTVPSLTGKIQFVDSQTGAFTQRFYKLVWAP